MEMSEELQIEVPGEKDDLVRRTTRQFDEESLTSSDGDDVDRIDKVQYRRYGESRPDSKCLTPSFELFEFLQFLIFYAFYTPLCYFWVIDAALKLQKQDESHVTLDWLIIIFIMFGGFFWIGFVTSWQESCGQSEENTPSNKRSVGFLTKLALIALHIAFPFVASAIVFNYDYDHACDSFALTSFVLLDGTLQIQAPFSSETDSMLPVTVGQSYLHSNAEAGTLVVGFNTTNAYRNIATTYANNDLVRSNLIMNMEVTFDRNGEGILRVDCEGNNPACITAKLSLKFNAPVSGYIRAQNERESKRLVASFKWWKNPMALSFDDERVLRTAKLPNKETIKMCANDLSTAVIGGVLVQTLQGHVAECTKCFNTCAGTAWKLVFLCTVKCESQCVGILLSS